MLYLTLRQLEYVTAVARTGSLLPPFVAHATFNSFAVTFIILNGLGVIELPA